MATPRLSLGLRHAIARYGFSTARDLYNSYYDAIDSIEKLVAEESIDCDFARTGKLDLAAKPAHFQDMKRTHDVLTERMGVDTTLVPRGQLDAEIGSARYDGGILDPLGAGLHVGKFVKGLGESAVRAGAESTRRPAWSRSTAWWHPPRARDLAWPDPSRPGPGRHERLHHTAVPMAAGPHRARRQLADAGVDYCWGGLVDMSMDRLVHAGE
jgi:glycine/D-amino acid oxidase-like deaminating enzyme